MVQRVFTFYSQVEPHETIEIISKVVSELKGKVKIDGNVVIAKWRCNNTTTFRHKFTFYVGKDVVRVVTKDSQELFYNRIKWEFGLNAVLRVWDGFIKTLEQMYTDMNFELESGKFHITSAKLMSNGIEQTYSSVSISKPSIGGALLGGALFGGVGAIVGGSGGKTHTIGGTSSNFSDTFLVKVRYSNGLNLEGTISKMSDIYHKIVAGLIETSADLKQDGER
jgi:hypothetical protein